MTTVDDRVAQLEAAIAAQERLRATLGDAVVEVTVRALRAQIEGLRASEPHASEGARLETLRRMLPTQAPYRWNLRRLRLGRVLDVGCGVGRNLRNCAPGSVSSASDDVGNTPPKRSTTATAEACRLRARA